MMNDERRLELVEQLRRCRSGLEVKRLRHGLRGEEARAVFFSPELSDLERAQLALLSKFDGTCAYPESNSEQKHGR